MIEIIGVVTIVVTGATVLGIKYIDYIKTIKERELELTKDTARCALEQSKTELESKTLAISCEAKIAEILKINHYCRSLSDRLIEKRVSDHLICRKGEEVDMERLKRFYEYGYEEGHEDGFNYCKKEAVAIATKK
jgi:hypothetical protein